MTVRVARRLVVLVHHYGLDHVLMDLGLLEVPDSHLRVADELATLQHLISQVLIVLSLLFLMGTGESTLSVHLFPQF